MGKPTDVRPVAATLYFLPVTARVPMKSGPEVLTHVTCARARLQIRGVSGRTAEGWGETPLNVQWLWPSALPYEARHQALQQLTVALAKAWSAFDATGHPIEIGHAFISERLPELLRDFNASRTNEPVPLLAALGCCSPFDIALHDAYGILHAKPVYETYSSDYMNHDLGSFLTPAADTSVSFSGRFPCNYLVPGATSLPAWHSVGGTDPLDAAERTGNEPDDGYPCLLADWIRRDGLRCLKVKLRGNDEAWDYARLVKVGEIGLANRVSWLSADFNCMATTPEYVTSILDRLLAKHPRLYAALLYIEQPFPYDLEADRIDVHSIAARKPLFLDESTHDWRLIRLGRELGWTGVALKTCKTQTGALLSLCWARAHRMMLMVQDLTNPMLAQIPHVQLAAHAHTIMGVETNAPQFYPAVSASEAKIHPGLYERRKGRVDPSSLAGYPGFGYRVDEIRRDLPEPAYSA